jgi:predicted dehydrogenase
MTAQTDGAAPLGVGLVGYGLGGRTFHAPFVRVTGGLELRAVVSRDPAKVSADLPDTPVVPSVEALLARGDIDVVVVSSPDELHAEHATAALNAGKHVLIDKPFAQSLPQAREVARLAEDKGRVLTIFHNRRWDADFLTLRRLLDDDRLGRIVHFESHFDRWRPEVAAGWKDARKGGSWFDLGAHLVDQAIGVMGRPRAVMADIAAMREGAPAPDWFHAVLFYPQGRAVLHSNKLAADHALRFAVHGTKGSWIKHGLDTQEPALVAGTRPDSADFGIDPVPGQLVIGDAPGQPVENATGAYQEFWHAFERALRGAGPNPVPAEQALTVMEVLEAGLLSGQRGTVVTL